MDVARLRRDFPLLRGPTPPAYLDNACTTLKPQSVIDAVSHYLSELGGCGGRSVHRRGAEVTRRVEGTRTKLARFLGAKTPTDVVFTKNTTESINLVAHAWPWKKGDVVATTDKEHNSNWLPWLHLAQTRGVRHLVLPSDAEGLLDLAAAERLLARAGPRLRLLSMVHTSNADGVTNPARELAALARARGATVLLDAAQSLPNQPVAAARLGVDFVAGSGHKMLGPPGVGFLWGTTEAWSRLGPFQLGGNTAKRAGDREWEWSEMPHRFEAGLQNYAGLLGFAPALDYLERVGRDAVARHEADLNASATKRLSGIPGVTIHGPPASRRGSILPFDVAGYSSHELALYLDEAGDVAVRSGAHCVQSYFARRGLDGWARASFYLYNDASDVERLVQGVERLVAARKRRRSQAAPISVA